MFDIIIIIFFKHLHAVFVAYVFSFLFIYIYIIDDNRKTSVVHGLRKKAQETFSWGEGITTEVGPMHDFMSPAVFVVLGASWAR
jgi:hypothetical protein